MKISNLEKSLIKIKGKHHLTIKKERSIYYLKKNSLQQKKEFLQINANTNSNGDCVPKNCF